MMVDHHYQFHDIGLVVATDDPAIADALALRLSGFAAPGPVRDALRFEVRTAPVDESRRRPSGRTIYDHDVADVRYNDQSDEVLVEHCGATMCCRPAMGTTVVHAPDSAPERAWTVSRPMFTIALLEMLKRRRHFSLHAAAVAARDGGVVLLAGASGSGKSTLALALGRRGLPVLGDDTVFLVDAAAGQRVQSFPDEVDVTATTIEMFTELHPVFDRLPAPATGKRQFRLEEFYDLPVVLDGEPVALVFPTIEETVHSTLITIDEADALVRLAPNVLLTEAAACQAHLDALGHLVRSVPCFAMATGSDLDAAVTLLSTFGWA